MAVGGVDRCIKYLLFLFNFAFVVIGIALIALGVSTQTGFVKYLHLFNTDAFTAPPKLFIAIGVIMFLIAFLGCCGAMMENHSMIMAYSVLVGLVLIMQLGVGVAAYLLEDDVENLARSGFLDSMNQYHNMSNPEVQDIKNSWDLVQSEFKCCGVDKYTDWKNATVSTGSLDPLVPTSCCIGGGHANCTESITITNIDNIDIVSKIINTQGCLPKAVHDLAIGKIGTVGIALSAVELLGVICACFLARSIRYSYETV